MIPQKRTVSVIRCRIVPLASCSPLDYVADLLKLVNRSSGNCPLSSKPNESQVNVSGVLKSGGCASQFTASCLTAVVSNGILDTHIDLLKEVFSKRAKVYASAIDAYWVPHGIRYNPCLGGYFFWIKLPEGLTSNLVSQEAAVDGISIMEGTTCMVPGDSAFPYQKFIRISIAFESEDRAVEGIKRLGKVFERLGVARV